MARKKKRPLEAKFCEWCQASFVPTRFWQKYCNPYHSWKAWDKRHPRQPLKQEET